MAKYFYVNGKNCSFPLWKEAKSVWIGVSWLEITSWVWSWHHYLLLNYAPSLIFSHPFFFFKWKKLIMSASWICQFLTSALYYFFFSWLPQFKTEKQLPFGCEDSSFWVHLCPGQALVFQVLGLTKSLDAAHSGREGSHRLLVIRYPIGNIYEVFVFTYEHPVL